MWRTMASVLLLAGMSAWGFWLISHAKGKQDYVLERAATTRQLVLCEWVPMNSPSVSSLGFSQDDGHAWSDRANAYLAFPVGAIPKGAWIDFDVAAVAKGEVLVDVDGGESRYAVREWGRVRIPVPGNANPGVVLVTFDSKDLLPPAGNEHRWLGLAISRLRICDGA